MLETAALCNGQQVNFSQIGSDAQVPPRTVSDYFQLFEDTLVGSLLHPFRKSPSRKAVVTPKFYMFDTGVVRLLARTGEIQPQSKAFGDAFEHLIYLELRAFLDYTFSNAELTYWRTESKLEVDFLIDDKFAIEAKGTGNVTPAHLKGLRALGEDFPDMKRIVVCNESLNREVDGVHIMPVDEFFKTLWAGKLI